MDLDDRKRAVRSEMRALRAAISPHERAVRSDALASRLFSLQEVGRAGCVLAFRSFGAEVSTDAIVGRLLDAGKRVLLPAVEADGMEAAEYRAGDPLVRSSYGALEPADRTPVDPTLVDLVIAPGLAFDREGNRLGYGGGYFDSFLRRMRQGATVVGVCFHEQLIQEVPTGPDDVRVDVVVTDREVLRSRQAPL